MPEGPIKCRIVSFRIAGDEYSKIEALAKNHGFASVSYFAREATLRSAPSESAKTPLDVQINRLWRRIEAVTSSIETLVTQLNVPLQLNTAAEYSACAEELSAE